MPSSGEYLLVILHLAEKIDAYGSSSTIASRPSQDATSEMLELVGRRSLCCVDGVRLAASPAGCREKIRDSSANG